MIQDVDLAGNSYTVRQGDRLARLRPDWVKILLGSNTRREEWTPGDPDTEVLAYIFKPGGPGGSEDEIVFPVDHVAHWAPYRDPFANYRGMSWLTPILREVLADQAMTSHKQKFIDNGATVNMVVEFDTDNLELFERYKRLFREGHQGLPNAYKTLFTAKGTTVTPVGANLQEVDFKHVQAAGETRLAAAAGVPSILVGFSEGLSGSSLNAGNYSTARRRFADGTIIPLWGGAADALASIIQVPGSAVLAVDARDVAFMKDDEKDAADIRQKDATTINTLFLAGFDPDAIVDAVTSDDFSRLAGQHSGIVSVQVQPAASNGASANGAENGSPKALAQSGTQ
jgi:phage portal protein BeeE